MSRREFLGAAAAGVAWGAAAGGEEPAGGPAAGGPAVPAVKIRKVYAGTDGTAWPGPSFNAATEIARYERCLAEVERALPGVTFVGGEQVKTVEEAAKAAGDLQGADAIFVFDLSFDDGGRVRRFVDTGLPTAVFVYPFTGHQWMYYSQWAKAGQKLLLLPTSDRREIGRAARLLAVPGRLKRSRILAVGPHGTPRACSPEEVRSRLGPELVLVPNDRVIAAHGAVDPNAAEAEAEAYWIKPATKIVEPKREEIINAARLYLALRKMLGEERAQAVASSSCMGAPAKGCFAFSKLNDEGFVGACEGDMDSTLTMLMFAYAFGIPGFITDPLFDLAKNAVVHAHCTSSTKMDGPGGERAPFVIRSQCDSDQGVSVKVQMRVGQAITCAKLANAETLLISTGKIVEIPNYEDRGCRTQIVTEVRDARRMLENWGGGVLPQDMMTLLHRVVFYGDRMRDAKELAVLMGLKVIEEA